MRQNTADHPPYVTMHNRDRGTFRRACEKGGYDVLPVNPHVFAASSSALCTRSVHPVETSMQTLAEGPGGYVF